MIVPYYSVKCKYVTVCSVFVLYALLSTGSILSNTDLSDLSTVGTCDIFVNQMRHRVM